jgi:molybdopterin/thiamine biosynthesis adenylyltransferase
MEALPQDVIPIIVPRNELNLSRQSKLVPVDKINQYQFKVFGVGSIGSHFVKTLAKTGFKNIEVFDMDTVEDENIAAQAYDFRHIGMKKVDAIKQIVEESTGVEIKTNHGMIDEKSMIVPEPNTFYCCFFDSFEARKLVFDKIKDYPILFVDGRIGRYEALLS